MAGQPSDTLVDPSTGAALDRTLLGPGQAPAAKATMPGLGDQPRGEPQTSSPATVETLPADGGPTPRPDEPKPTDRSGPTPDRSSLHRLTILPRTAGDVAKRSAPAQERFALRSTSC